MIACFVCGTEFQPLRTQRMCSPECSRKRTRALEREKTRTSRLGSCRQANITDEERDRRDTRIVAALRDGVPTSAVVERFRVSLSYVQACAARAGHTISRQRLPLGSPAP